MTRKRSNAQNTGKQLEKILEHVHAIYRRTGKADLEKVDPPVKVVGRGRVIFQSNPFLDYIGAQADGRLICIEAKSTDGGRLPCGGKNGLTANQIAAMRRWQATGALVGCLWYCFEFQELRIVTLADIDITLEHRKSVTWETAQPIPDPETFDYLAKLREIDELRKRYEIGT